MILWQEVALRQGAVDDYCVYHQWWFAPVLFTKKRVEKMLFLPLFPHQPGTSIDLFFALLKVTVNCSSVILLICESATTINPSTTSSVRDANNSNC